MEIDEIDEINEARAIRTTFEWLTAPRALEFGDLLSAMQERIVELQARPGEGSVMFAEIPRCLTIGRDGQREDIRLSDRDLASLRLPVHYVARGGGTMLHLPGQIAMYPLLPIAAWSIAPGDYVRRLADVALETLREFDAPAELDDGVKLHVHGRRIAHLGVAVDSRSTGFGLLLNVNPDLRLFRGIRVDGDADPMTSLARETIYRIDPDRIRQRLLDRLADAFSLRRQPLHYHRPWTFLPVARHAFA